MKKILLGSILCALTLTMSAQNEQKAKEYLLAAETSLQNKDYANALLLSEQSEKEFGKASVRTLYVKISAGKEHALVDTSYETKTYKWISQFLNLTSVYKVEPEKLKEVQDLRQTLHNYYNIKKAEKVTTLARSWVFQSAPELDVEFNKLPKQFLKTLNIDYPVEGMDMFFRNHEMIEFKSRSYAIKDFRIKCKTGIEGVSVLEVNSIVYGYDYIFYCGKSKDKALEVYNAEVKKLKDYFGTQNIQEGDGSCMVASNDSKMISLSLGDDGYVSMKVADLDVVRKYLKL